MVADDIPAILYRFSMRLKGGVFFSSSKGARVIEPMSTSEIEQTSPFKSNCTEPCSQQVTILLT